MSSPRLVGKLHRNGRIRSMRPRVATTWQSLRSRGIVIALPTLMPRNFNRHPIHLVLLAKSFAFSLVLVGARCATAQLNVSAEPRSVSYNASNFVPLDSWVYPALERLATFSYIPSSQLGMRPWTRIECARLTEEARSNFGRSDSIYDDQAAPLYTRLSEEFSFEIHVLAGASNRRVEETQAYFRATEITGPPLRDSFHFGQTIYNDFGRPYGQGFNASTGTQVQAMFGLVSVSVRGEFQSSRALFSYGPNALAAIASADALPVMTMPNIGAYQRFRPLEATVSLKLAGWQATFGEQPQWWGVSRSTSLLLSNNAEAPVLLLIKRDKPIQLPASSLILASSVTPSSWENFADSISFGGLYQLWHSRGRRPKP